MKIERTGANFDISNGLLRPAYEQRCARGEATKVDCGYVLRRTTSGAGAQCPAVDHPDAITISVSAGYGEQLNHAYTLAVPKTVFAASVKPGPYIRESSRPLCLPVYFEKGHHRATAECAKVARERLVGAQSQRDERLALLEAYAVADEEDRRNIGLVHLRTAALREFAAEVAVPRSSLLGEPLRSFTDQPCPDCIERHVDGRTYFDVRRHCEASYLPEDHSGNETERSNVQVCAYRIMRDQLAPAAGGGPPSRALTGTPVLDAAGPGVVAETDRFGSYWEAVDAAVREASVNRMGEIVEEADRLVKEVGGQQRNVLSRLFAEVRAFLSSAFARDQRTVQEHELESALEPLRENLATGRAAAKARKARASLDFAQAWRAHESHMSRREALDAVLNRLTRHQSELAALRSRLRQTHDAMADGGMSSEAAERLEAMRAGLVEIANDIDVPVDDLKRDTRSDLGRMTEMLAHALTRRIAGIGVRKKEAGETTETAKAFAGAKDRLSAVVSELELLEKVAERRLLLEEEARTLIALISPDGGVSAQRDAQADVCSTHSWPSRDTVGFISVFFRPTPDQIGFEIMERTRHPGAYLLPLDVTAIEPPLATWRDALDDDARRLVTYFNSEFGHEEITRVVNRGAIVVYIPLSASADLAAFRRDLWIALKALSTRNGDHVALRDALESIGYVHHRQDPYYPERGRYFVYSPRLVVTYAGNKPAKAIAQAVKAKMLKSRLFAIANNDPAELKAHPRWRDVVEWLTDDRRSVPDSTVTNLMDLQDMTKAPDVLVVRRPSVKTVPVQVSPPSGSTPARTCTDYEVSGNFHDPRTQLTRLICENIVETGWPFWRFE